MSELRASGAAAGAWAGVVLALAAGAGGRTVYVAPDPPGGGDGSRDRPIGVERLGRAGTLRPGDEAVFRDGVYKGPLTIKTTGTEQAPIVYRAEHRHKAIFDGSTRIAGWRAVDGEKGVWQCRLRKAPRRLLVDGEGLIAAGSRWRGDGKRTLEEGMFACEKLTDAALTLKEDPADVRVRMRPWGGRAPREVRAVGGCLVTVGGAYNIVEGFLIRRAMTGVHLAGRAVHTHRHEAGVYRDLSGLVHNTSGCYNIVRGCIIRDILGCGLTSNESRFNLVADNVIYNAGMGQGDHGIYVSQGAEDLTIRRNVWWRTSGGAIHVYSGSGIDSPRGIVIEHNVFGPDKRNRCFPVKNRKSCAVYLWGGSRRAGRNRVVGNLVIGPHDRAISMHRCHFNLIAGNTLLGSDGAAIQVGSGVGSLIVNNIIECAPGSAEAGCQPHPAGYVHFHDERRGPAVCRVRNNLLIPRGGRGRTVPGWMEASKLAAGDPFVDRARLNFALRPGGAAIDAGLALPGVTGTPRGTAPDAGALELGEKGKLPAIPQWLLDEWPLSRRGQ